MKKLHLFSAGLLALAMTACDSDEPMGNNPGGGSADGTSGQYIAVSILNADAAPSGRAVTEGDKDGQIKYVNGTTAENAIAKGQLHFLFFDDKGNPFAMTGTNVNGSIQTETEGEGEDAVTTATNWVKPLTVTAGNINNSTSSSTTEAVLVLGNAAGSYKGNMPSRIVCIANVTDEVIKDNFMNKSISKLLGADAKKFTDLYTTNTDGTATNFIMSSSSWYNGSETVCWSEIHTNNIQSTATNAGNNPVNIYIERLASRVSVTSMPSSPVVKQAKGDTYEAMPFSYNAIVNGEVKTIEGKNILAVPTGWALNNDTQTANGIKKLTGAEAFFANANEWNIGVRSYWASTSSNTAVADFIPSSLTNPVNTIVYAHANTKDPFLQGNGESGVSTMRGQQNFARTYATKILVGAKFYIVDEGTTTVPEKEEGDNFMFWGGMYYTPEALCKVLSRDLKDGQYVAYSRVTETGNDTGNYMVKFYTVSDASLAGTNLTQNDGTAPTNATIISNIPAAQCWSGMGYYILNISNDLISTAGTYSGKNMYGVVRNHAYTYELTDFVGLGTPVPCTDITTRVENPAVSNTYVAARLNVLNWRLVSNKTVLQ